MANIQYADDGIYTVNFHAEDDCGNRTTGVRTINARELQYTISFDSKGGSVVAAILVNEGDDATGFAEPTKEGVAFKGWYDNYYCYGDPITIIEDVQTDYTLYAKWGEETYGTYLFGSPTHALVINCPESKKQQYISTYGAIYTEYPAWSMTNEYDFNADSDVHWAYRRGAITTLIIGSNVKPNNLAYWFYGFDAISDVQGMDKIDTSRCVSMKSTFEDFHYRNKPLDISMWDVSNVQNFVQAFSNAYFSTLNVSTWITSSATNMRRTFANMQLTGTNPVVDLSTWEFGNVTNLYQMFAGSTMHTIRFGNPDTSQVTTFYQMFAMCAVTTIYSDDFDTSSETSTSSALFNGAENLVGGNGTAYNSSNVNSDYAVVDKPGRPGYFTAPVTVKVTFVTNITSVPDFDMTYNTRTSITLPTPTDPVGRPFIGWHYASDLSDPVVTTTTFYNSTTLYGEWGEEPVSDMHMLFFDAGGTEEGTLILSIPNDETIINELKAQYGSEVTTFRNSDNQTIGWQNSTDKAKITYVRAYGDKCVIAPTRQVFYQCSNMKTCDLSKLVYSSAWESNDGQIDWSSAFCYCTAVTDIILPTKAHYGASVNWSSPSFFKACRSLTSIPDLPCEDIRHSSSMFEDTRFTTITVKHRMQPNIGMTKMFANCPNLRTVNFPSDLNPQALQLLTGMFQDCPVLTTINNFDKVIIPVTSQYVDLAAMFKNCTAIRTIDMSGVFQVSPYVVRSIKEIFAYCTNLTTIYAPAGTTYESSSSTLATDWCRESRNLVGGAGTTYSQAMYDSRTYCRIDGGSSAKGMLTVKP